jgi:asparagine synthase (glutamine-hydrolysing)
MNQSHPIPEWPLIILRSDHSGMTTLRGSATAACGSRSDGASDSDPYCEWTWDGESLAARTDRYGFFPLFYYVWDDGIMLSPSLAALLHAGAPTQLDDAAVAVLLRRWMCVGQDTPFARIRILPPGGRLTWCPGQPLQLEKSYVFAQRASMSRTAAVDGYIDRFREAIRRRPASGTSVVPLSGGRDSRHIFLELCASGHPPDVAVTVGRCGRQTTPNGQVASALARRAGVRHVILSLPQSRWRAQRDMARATHLSTVDIWWQDSLIAYIYHSSGESSVYEGVAGDVLSTALYKEERLRRLYDQGKLVALAEAMLGPERYYEQILSPTFHRRFRRELAIERIVAELAEHAPAPNPLASFFVYNRTRRVTALSPTTLLSPHATVWCPYLDADVWDHLSSLGPEFLEGSTMSAFHDEAIHRAYPKFANIPFGTKWGGHRAYDLRTIAEMAGAVTRRPPAMIRKSFLLPRLARGILDPTYTRSAAELTPMIAYLTELEASTQPHRHAHAP